MHLGFFLTRGLESKGVPSAPCDTREGSPWWTLSEASILPMATSTSTVFLYCPSLSFLRRWEREGKERSFSQKTLVFWITMKTSYQSLVWVKHKSAFNFCRCISNALQIFIISSWNVSQHVRRYTVKFCISN